MNAESHILAGVRLIRLQGNDDARARQHGNYLQSLTHEQKKRLPFTPLAKKNQYLISRALLSQSKTLSPLATLLTQSYEGIVKNRWKSIPKHYQKRLDPFIEQSGIDPNICHLALFQPDLLMILAALATDKVKGLFMEGMPGCTAGAFFPNQDEPSYFLRNLDYPLASYWEPNNAVFYHEPSEAQKYVSIAALGMHTAGLTAQNESGIAFSLNAHFAKKFSLRGTPIFFLGDDIMREARTLDDVIRICKRFKTMGSWVIIAASFQERRAISIELSGGKVWVREDEPLSENKKGPRMICHANGFLNPDFESDTLHFPQSLLLDLYARKNAMESSLKNKGDHLSLNQALLALGDHTDPISGKTRIFGNTVSVVTTVQSVLFSPNEKSFYVSNRSETPSGLGPFLKLPLSWSDIDDTTFSQIPYSPTTIYSEEFIAALHEYHLAYVIWHVDHGSLEQTLQHLRRATEIYPSDPHVQLQRAYFEIMSGNLTLATHCLQTAQPNLSPSLSTVADYFLGACHDLHGNREMALRSYQKVLGSTQSDDQLKDKAKKRLTKRYTASEAKRIEPDLQFTEPVQYS